MNSYRDPTAKWLGSPNFTPNRDGHYLAAEDGIPGKGASYIVLHTMVGTVASANSRFQQAVQQASAHYGIGYDGHRVQWVDEKDAAWHAGDFTVNLDSIGIEHEDMGNYNSPRPDALYKSSAILVAQICKRYKLPAQRGDKAKGRSGCIDHRTVHATACPDSLDTNRIISLAAAYLKFLNGQGPDPFAVVPVPAPPVGWKTSQTSKAFTGAFTAFEPGAILSARYASAPHVAELAKGAPVTVEGYSYAEPPVLSSDLTGNGQPGNDYLWWHTTSPKTGYVTDAKLDTTGAGNLPQNAKYDDLAPPPPPIYVALAPDGSVIAKGTTPEAVALLAQAWQVNNRSKAVTITKDGAAYQTLPAVPPDPEPPKPDPNAPPTPSFGWEALRTFLRDILKWITG